MTPVRDAMERKLTQALAPGHLEIIDDSGRHAGHGGSRPEGESHFSLLVASDLFEGKSRVARQRLVYDILAEELKGPLHALSATCVTLSEFAQIQSKRD